MNHGNDMTEIEKIQANAELVINMGKDLGADLKFDKESVKWIDDFIERHRKAIDQGLTKKFISVFGSFVGECIRHEFGGEWKEVNGGWGVSVGSSSVVFPGYKISNQFAQGHEGGETIYGLVDLIPTLIERNNSRDTHQDHTNNSAE